MNAQWLNIIGLFSDIIGALFLSYGLLISKKSAIRLGVSRLCSKDEKENLKLPQVKDRLKQSRNAIIGLSFLTIGFLLQMIANWPNN